MTHLGSQGLWLERTEARGGRKEPGLLGEHRSGRWREGVGKMGAGCSRRDKGPGGIPEGGFGVGEMVGQGKRLAPGTALPQQGQ